MYYLGVSDCGHGCVGPRYRTLIAYVVAGSAILCMASRVASAQAPVLTRRALRREALGCFTLFDAHRQSTWGRLRNAPAIARLDSAANALHTNLYPRGATYRRVESRDMGNYVIAESSPNRLAPVWSADSLSDSIRIVFSDGYTGSGFIFALPTGSRGDSLVGRAYTFVDAGPPYRTDRGRAFAVRRPCE